MKTGIGDYKAQLIGREFPAKTRSTSQVFRAEFKTWSRWIKTMEDKWEVIVVPVSVHAENVLRELRDMFTGFYKRNGSTMPNALMMFALGILAHLIAKVNKIEWEMEKK